MTTFRTPALPYPSKAISSNHTSFDLFLDPTNHIPSQQTSKIHSPPDKNQERQKCPLKTLILKAAISPTWPLTAPLFPQIQQSKGLFPLFPDQARSQTIRTIRTTMELPIWQVLLTTRPTFQGWVLITLYIWPTHRPIFNLFFPVRLTTPSCRRLETMHPRPMSSHALGIHFRQRLDRRDYTTSSIKT